MLINRCNLTLKMYLLSYFHPKIINIRKYFNFVIVEIIILLLLMVVLFSDKKIAQYMIYYIYI